MCSERSCKRMEAGILQCQGERWLRLSTGKAPASEGGSLGAEEAPRASSPCWEPSSAPASSPSPASDSAQLPAKGLSWFCRSLERKDHQQTWAKSPKAKRRRKRRIPMSPRSLCQPTPCFSETRKPLSKGKTPMLPSETYRKLLHQCGTVWEKNKNK